MAVKGGKEEVVDVKRSKMAKAEAALEERKLSEMLIPKKKQRLYKKIMLKKKKTAREVSVRSRMRRSISSFTQHVDFFQAQVLTEKRQKIDSEEKRRQKKRK